jgi:predicted AAA+ superfamily ATPase
MLIENIVAQMLRASGHKLYFYSRNSNETEERMEIDFLIAKSKITTRHNISPIEVKSSTNYTLTSLNKFTKKFANYLSTSYVVHGADLEIKGDTVYLPFYMVPLL